MIQEEPKEGVDLLPGETADITAALDFAKTKARAERKARRLKNEAYVRRAPIEKGIPIPPMVQDAKTRVYYDLLKRMECGDSVILPKKLLGSLTVEVNYGSKREECFIVSRKVDEEFLRIWKMKKNDPDCQHEYASEYTHHCTKCKYDRTKS